MIIGIDPGLTGAVCYMSGQSIILEDMPLCGKEIDIVMLFSRLSHSDHIYIEQLGIRPRQKGVQTMIRNWQRIEDAAVLSGSSVEIVPPKVWQKGIVPSTAQGNRKAVISAYCNYARKKYPQAVLIPKGKKVIQDGRAAALCICDWALRERMRT